MKLNRILLFILVFSAGCIISGGGPAYAEGPLVGPVAVVSGPSPFEQGCDGGMSNGFTNYHNYEVEPYVAVNPLNPLNIAVSWQQDRWLWGGANGSVTAVTHDGGITWGRAVMPGLTRCSGGQMERSADDWLTFAPNGDLYHIGLTFNSDFMSDKLQVHKSTDGGSTWSGPVIVHASDTPNTSNDKESITADPHDSRYVYASWGRFQFASGVPPTPNARRSRGVKETTWFTRTADSGATWEPGREIFDPGEHNYTHGHQIVVLPNGELLDFFNLTMERSNEHGTRGRHIAFIRSGDKGETWSGPRIIERLDAVYVDDPTTGEWLLTGSTIIDVAVDRQNGGLYVVWEDGRFSGYAKEGIAFIKSTDGGLTWSSPMQVNGAPSAPAFTPSVAVADDGTVAVTYYDLRNDTSDPSILQTDHWIAVSRDGGGSWTEAHLAGPFDMRSAPEPGAFWYFLGDYVGLAPAGNSFVAAFPLANYGAPSNPTDIFISTIEP